jgi:hypothetical protein
LTGGQQWFFSIPSSAPCNIITAGAQNNFVVEKYC